MDRHNACPTADMRPFTLFGLTLVMASAACSGRDTSSNEAQAVVGGQLESGYPSVGYVASGESARPFCTVTLIAPDAVLTAGHCIHGTEPENYWVGFGDAMDRNAHRIAAASVERHPDFRRNLMIDWNDTAAWNDVAVIKLREPVRDRPIATMGVAETRCGHRYIGYGQTTPSQDPGPATTGERRSTKVCVSGQNQSEILITGEGGAVCYGDSGGPLMLEGTNQIVGVLSRAAPVPDGWDICGVGRSAVMTRVAAFREFITSQTPTAHWMPLPPRRTVEACVIDRQEDIRVRAFEATPSLSARVYVANETPVRGPMRGLRGEIGAGPVGSDPSKPGWNWFASEFMYDSGDDDSWMGSFAPFAPGEYEVAYRFSADGGQTYAYCDRRYALREYSSEEAIKMHVTAR